MSSLPPSTASKPQSAVPKEIGERGQGPFPFYPLLIAVFPVVGVFSANLSIFPLHDLLRPLLVSLAAGAVLLGSGSLLFRSWKKGAAAAAVIIGTVWSWTFLRTAFPAYEWRLAGPVVIPLLGLASAFAAGRWAPNPKALNLISACILGFSALSLAWNVSHPPKPKQTEGMADVVELPKGPRPDIFHLVLDGFGSQASLKGALDIDLAWFIQGLKERGFHVADDARTNYVQTELSLASTLNFDFIPSLLPEVSPEEHDRRYLSPLIGESAAMKKLIKSGYRFNMLGSGFPALRFGRYEIELPSNEKISLFEGALLEMTPWRQSGQTASSQYRQHYDELNLAYNWLEANARPTAVPRFTFAHILAPHPPFVVDETGGFVKPKGPYGLWDGSDFLQNFGNDSQYRRGYANKAGYAARRTLKVIDELLKSNPKNPPIIIIQGDHGSKLHLDQNSLEKTDLNETFPILYALCFPQEIRPAMKPVETPVNTYRKIFRALGEKELPDLEDRSWYSTFPKPFRLVEVTDRLKPLSP